MKTNITVAAAVMAAISNLRVNVFGRMNGANTLSAAQQRRSDAWVADAPRRARLAAECAEWNKNVKRRNQRFVRRQIARGRTAS